MHRHKKILEGMTASGKKQGERLFLKEILIPSIFLMTQKMLLCDQIETLTILTWKIFQVICVQTEYEDVLKILQSVSMFFIFYFCKD